MTPLSTAARSLLFLIVTTGTLTEHARARKLLASLSHADEVAEVWTMIPANWCTKPGCTRCQWGTR